MTPSSEKVKAVAGCVSCGTVIPVRLWSDGTVHPIGATRCCEVSDYEVLEPD